MGIIEEISAQAITRLLNVVIAHSGDEKFNQTIEAMNLGGNALLELAEMVKDKNVDPAEVEKIVKDLQDAGQITVVNVILSSIMKIVQGIFGGV